MTRTKLSRRNLFALGALLPFMTAGCAQTYSQMPADGQKPEKKTPATVEEFKARFGEHVAQHWGHMQRVWPGMDYSRHTALAFHVADDGSIKQAWASTVDGTRDVPASELEGITPPPPGGYSHITFDGREAVVLFATGTCFILLPWLAAARTITLVVSAVWLAVLSTGIAFYEFAAGYMGLNLPQLPPNISAPYPLAAWAAYMLMGLITYRVLLTNQRAQIGTALVGSVLAAAGIALRRSLDFEQLMSLGSTPPAWLGLLNPLPHSGTFVDVAISGAGALALLSLCLLLAQGQWVYPLAAMGSMSLTAYIAHIVSFAAVLGVSGGYSEPLAWATILVLLIFASLWQHFLGRGPAEYALTAAVRALQPKEKKHA